MDINLTLIVQMLVFAAFILFTMRFVWPPLSKALEERQHKIAEGLAAAERGRKELELAQYRVKDELKHARAQASEIIEKANRHAAYLIEEAKEEAKRQAQRQIKGAQEQLRQEMNHAKDELRRQVGQLAIACAEKIIGHEIDSKTNHVMVDKMIEEI